MAFPRFLLLPFRVALALVGRRSEAATKAALQFTRQAVRGQRPALPFNVPPSQALMLHPPRDSSKAPDPSCSSGVNVGGPAI